MQPQTTTWIPLLVAILAAIASIGAAIISAMAATRTSRARDRMELLAHRVAFQETSTNTLRDDVRKLFEAFESSEEDLGRIFGAAEMVRTNPLVTPELDGSVHQLCLHLSACQHAREQDPDAPFFDSQILGAAMAGIRQSIREILAEAQRQKEALLPRAKRD